MLIIIENPKGQIPAIDPSLLPANFAQIAKNCDLRTGRLKPLKDLETTKTWAALGIDLRSLYKEESADKWLYWTENDINVVKAQLADGDNRLFYSGDGYPKQTNDTLMPATGIPNATDDYRRLGVTPPSVTLTINGPYGAGDGVTKYSVSYYYTYVVKWADGTEEESKPVAATAVTNIEGGEYLALSGFVKPTLVASGNDVTHFRVYRLASGDAGAEYQLAKMRPASTGAAAIYDIPVGDLPTDTTKAYDCDSTPDDLNSDLGEACLTETWVAPPDDLAQLGQYQNGILGGFSGKQFCVSEPFIHYAWPTGNRINLNYTPVAWGTYRGMAIIATTAFPSVITGADSSTLMQEPLKYNQRCLSARGFIITDIGALYPSPDGMTLVNENGVKVLTAKVLTKEQWNDLPPAGFTHADLVSFYYDDIYIGFWAGTGQGFVYNFKDDPYITTFEIDDTIFYHGFLDPTDDTLYLLTHAGTDYFAKAWESSATCLTLTFKSKKFIESKGAFLFAKIIGDQSVSVSVTLKVYGDGDEVSEKTIYGTDIFRLGLKSEYSLHEFEISSKAEMDKVLVATSPEEIIEAL